MSEIQKFKCSRCQCFKIESEFNKTKKDIRAKTCKVCDEYRKSYYKKQRELEDEMNWKLDKKIWKSHPEHPNIYCNELGQVINKKTKKFIGKLTPNGYIQLGLNIDENGKQIFKLAHHFIYECWKGVIPEGKVVNHINEIKHDNRIENLELVSLSENTKKSTKSQEINKQGRRKPKKCLGKQEDKKEWIEFKSLADASRKTKINHRSIQSVCDGIYNSCTSKSDNSKWVFKYQI